MTFSKKQRIMHNVNKKIRSVKSWQLFLPAFFRRPLFFLRANIIWNNIQNPQKYLRFSVTDGIIYLGKHQKYNLLHSIPSTPRVAVPKKRTEDLAMTDYGRTDIFLGESRVNRSALLLQQQVFLHNKINRTIPETGYFCAVPGFLRFKRAVIYGL